MTYYPDRISYIDGSKGKRSRYSAKKRYRNQEPFLCKKCNKVWQPLREYKTRPDFLDGFPKIGCTVKICSNCKRKEMKG
tara:strand:+ start:269 stop:505 length:237 start_codon:yes stop_codon:yes gene_type:complete